MLAGSPSTNTEKLEPRVFSQVARNSRRSSRLRRTLALRGRTPACCGRFENVTMPFRISPDPSWIPNGCTRSTRTPSTMMFPCSVTWNSTIRLSAAALFVVTQSSLSPIECLRSLFADVGVLVVSHGFELRLRFGNSSLALLSSSPQFAYQGAERLIDLPAFLVYLPVECLSPDHSAEVAQRKNILE